MDYEPIKNNIVVDYEGKEIFSGDKVRFIVETADGEEEYWVGVVKDVTDFSADADSCGDSYGIEPQVLVEYTHMGIPTIERFLTGQQIGKSWIFICEELEIIEGEGDYHV